MALYIKANPLVAKFLHLQDVRNTVKDNNYLLWQADMQAFGPLSNLPATLEMIGGLALSPREARQEQDGTVIRPLPVATDPRFIVGTTQNPAKSEPETEEVETEAPAGESPAEATNEAPAEESEPSEEETEVESQPNKEE